MSLSDHMIKCDVKSPGLDWQQVDRVQMFLPQMKAGIIIWMSTTGQAENGSVLFHCSLRASLQLCCCEKVEHSLFYVNMELQ